MMGDAAEQPKKPAPPVMVELLVCANAHVDEAYTSHGFVSKTAPLCVPKNDARLLLAAHPYLTTGVGE